MAADQNRSAVARTWIARVFTVLEDIVYVGLGVLLGSSAIVLLASGVHADDPCINWQAHDVVEE